MLRKIIIFLLILMRQFKNISNSPFTSDTAIILEISSLFPDFDEPLQKLIAGMAGCSPFLHDLVKKEVNWITKVLKSGSKTWQTTLPFRSYN